MTVALIQVPYDSGQREQRMGLGPGRLMALGAREAAARAHGGEAVPARIDSDEAFPLEVATAFDLARKLSGDVARARRSGAFPLVLAGNCMSAVGTLAGLAEVPRLGVVWLDAHGDLNTPETSPSGFLDGMALAVATGRCWRALAESVPGFEAIPDRRVLHAGARALDPAERDLLGAGEMAVVDGATFRAQGAEALDAALDALAGQVDAVYLHLDLDVHDAAELTANPFAAPGGPSAAQAREAVARVAGRLPVVAAALTAYAPEWDRDGAAGQAALELIAALLAVRPRG